MKRIRLVTGLIATNVYLIGDETTGEAAVIDPAANCRGILAEAEKNGLTVGKILLTHGHFDHIGAADELSAVTGAEIYVSAPDAELLSDGNKNGSLLFLRRAVVCRSTARIFHDGDVISVGGIHPESSGIESGLRLERGIGVVRQNQDGPAVGVAGVGLQAAVGFHLGDVAVPMVVGEAVEDGGILPPDADELLEILVKGAIFWLFQ